MAQTLTFLGQQVAHETLWPPQQFLDLLEVFEREEKAPASLFDRALARSFFGNHPLGRRPMVDEIQRITAADVLNWVHQVRRPRNAALVIVGDFDPAEAVRSAELQFADWGDGADAPAAVSMPTSNRVGARAQDDGDRLVVQDRPGSLKASLRLRCSLPQFTADKLAAHAIFEEAIERTLMSELREQLGASYGVASRTAVMRGGVAYYELEADADYERLAAALRSARDLFRRPSAAFEDPVRFDELNPSPLRAATSTPARPQARCSSYGTWAGHWMRSIESRSKLAGFAPTRFASSLIVARRPGFSACSETRRRYAPPGARLQPRAPSAQPGRRP